MFNDSKKVEFDLNGQPGRLLPLFYDKPLPRPVRPEDGEV